MSATPVFNSTVQSCLSRIEFEIRSVLGRSPDGLTNSQVAACIGLGKDDPKQWMSYALLQRLVSKGHARKDVASKRYFSVTQETKPAQVA
jgi:hypothetical protein